eukprot:3800629-Amphidinium_carterae.1
MGEKEAKKMTTFPPGEMTTYPPGAHRVIIMNNLHITNFNEGSRTTSPMTPTTQRDKEPPTT